MQSEQLNNLLNTYRISLNWDPEFWTENKLEKLKNYMEHNNLNCCIVSVSGGIDSAVTYKLCKEAQKRYPNVVKKVVAINQPICSSKWALDRSKELTDENDLKVIDQTDVFLNLVKKVSPEFDQNKLSFAENQLKSYMRTPVNYYVSQMLNGLGYKSIVMGTGNKDEDGYLAYFCKYGDGAVDVQLIADLHKSQVFKLGEFLKVPNSILKAKPSADLWDGQEDEKELGFSYDFIELYIGLYYMLDEFQKDEFIKTLDNEALEEFLIYEKKANEIHQRNFHKLKGVVNL